MFDFGNANEQQREAITTTEGPLLIIAGPGTGKTFTLVKRVVYLITEKNVAPEEIMIATFTEKAAKELVTRITNELLNIGISINLNEMYVGTFHSICLRIIKENLEYTRVKKNYRMLDEFDQQYLIFQHINQFRKQPHFDSLFPATMGAWRQAGQIAKYANNLIEELVDIEEMKGDKSNEVRAIAEIIFLYQTLLNDENLIDFSSIQTEAYYLLKNNASILEGIQNKIKYVMVDEYQDTNYIQELLIFLITANSKNLCVVGDDDQGLYRFRGATIRNILEFPSHFEEDEYKKVDLTTNYRSEKEIIDFYNKWMAITDGRNFEFSWKNFRFSKEIIPGKKDYSKDTRVVTCSGANDLDDWYDSVLTFVKKLKNDGTVTDYNQIAFLCKSVKNDKVVGLIQHLEDNNVPVYSPRSEMFFQRQEIKELIGCLIICLPKYFLGLKTDSFKYSFPGLYEYYREECIPAAQAIIKKNKNSLGKWVDEKLRKHSSLKNNTDYAFSGLLYQLLEFDPFKTYVGINMGEGIMDERPARNLSILSSVIGKFEYLHRVEVFTQKNIETIPETFFNMYLRFLYDGGITEYEDDSEYAPSGCMSFMTIHQSKGMEFPIVMVDSLGAIPRTQSDKIIESIENKYFHREAFETREDIKFFDFWRLYYTAFSRAQNLLVLSCYEKQGHGKTPSKYFEEIYSEIPRYEMVDLTGLQLDQVKPVNIKDTFSFTSHIEVYETCSLQYKFFKELGFAQIRVGATLFGTLVHETIEDVHRAAMRHEESTITPENVRIWLDSNYTTLSKSEHSYLGEKQIDAAYQQVLRYVDREKHDWSRIQDAEVEVSLVKPDYILKGTVDLIRGKAGTVELVDFKSEKKPDITTESMKRYKRQLEVYAHLVEEKTGNTVSKMHLYYTGDETGEPMISFEKSKASIESTIYEFDNVVEKIHKHDFSSEAKDKKTCQNCDMRYHCQKVNK